MRVQFFNVKLVIYSEGKTIYLIIKINWASICLKSESNITALANK